MYSKPLIIGVGHKKRVGKDSVARRLVDKWGFHRFSFADPLKEAARLIFHFTDEQLYGEKKEVIDPRWDKTPREIMQKLGSEGLRDAIDPDVWIKSLRIKIDVLSTQVHGQLRVVIPDVRFPNEADAILSWGGVLWKVNRVLPPDQFSNHPSETALDDYKKWTEELNNDNTLAHLYQKADQLMAAILNPPEKSNAFNRRPAKDL